jgi:hypothetical protein
MDDEEALLILLTQILEWLGYEKRHRNYAARRFLNRFDPCF